MRNLNLEDAHLKVDRAKQHLRELQRAEFAFLSLNPYSAYLDQSPDSPVRLWRVRVHRDVPREISLVTGDVVHNLRAALDYLAWQLVIANGKTPNKQVQFPVRNPHSPLDTKKREADLERFGQKAFDLVEQLQPNESTFPGDVDLHPLWMLHQIDIQDKHKLLNVVGGALADFQWGVAPTGRTGYIDYMVIGPGPKRIVPLVDGDLLMDAIESPNNREVGLNVTFTFHLAFDQSGPGKGMPVVQQCQAFVELGDYLLGAFSDLVRSSH